MNSLNLNNLSRQCLGTIFIVAGVLFSAFIYSSPTAKAAQNPTDTIRRAIAKGVLVYKLTTPEELKKLLGPAAKEEKKHDGGMEVLFLEYSGINAGFGRMRDRDVPFTLLFLTVEGTAVDIGQTKQIVLRNTRDLLKFDSFWGFANISLVNLDLKSHSELLAKMPFDSQTKWPDPNKLPDGFNPAVLLEKGKNPGLHVRDLHKKGIDGHGVGIAIIDQPLLKDHIEYAHCLKYYEAIEVENVPVQMHGPPVCSIAAGKTCGVAPGASLYYFATPSWKWTGSSKPWADVIDKIIELNKTIKGCDKIRVASISLGAFSQRENFDLWEAAVKRANQNGILVVTCDPTFIRLGLLRHIEGRSEQPSDYECGEYRFPDAVLFVPTSNRTIASHQGKDVYTYERSGGMSWAVPYLAGLAALAYQIDPDIEPGKIVELWLQTAVKTDVGPVVNPNGFIQKVSELKSPNKQ